MAIDHIELFSKETIASIKETQKKAIQFLKKAKREMDELDKKIKRSVKNGNN